MRNRLADPQVLLFVGAVAGVSLLVAPRIPLIGARMRAAGGDLAVWLLVVTAGPVALAVQSFSGEEGPSGALLLASQATTAVVVVCSAFSVVRSRRVDWVVVIGIGGFYGATALGAAFGTVPSFPQALWLTPLTLVAVARRDLTAAWVAQLVGRAAVGVAAASLLAVVLAPSVALQEDVRYLPLRRVSGLAVHANGLGAVAVVAIVVQLTRKRRLTSPSVVVSIAALVVAQSWTGWLMLGVAATFLSGDRRWPTAARRATLGALVVVLAAAALVPSMVMPHVEAVASDDDAFTGRRHIWKVALAEHDDSPWFGYGPKLLDEDFRRRNGLHGADFAGQAHNQAVQTLGDSGYVGLLGLAVLVAAWLRAARRPRHEAALPLFAVLAVRALSETPLRPAGASLFLLSVGALLSARAGHVPTAFENDRENAVARRLSQETEFPGAFDRAGSAR